MKDEGVHGNDEDDDGGRVWEVTRDCDVVGVIEARDTDQTTTYSAACQVEEDCWQSSAVGSDLEETADRVAAHIHDHHTPESEQPPELSVTPRTPEVTLIRQEMPELLQARAIEGDTETVSTNAGRSDSASRHKSEYQRGYLDGYRDDEGSAIGLSESYQFADMVHAPDEELELKGSYWIGYWHGRQHALTGEPATGVTEDDIPPQL